MSQPRPIVGICLEPERVAWLTRERAGSLPARVARRPNGRALVPVPRYWVGPVERAFSAEAPFVRDEEAAIALVWQAAAEALRSPLTGILRPVLVLEAPLLADEGALGRIGRAAGAWATIVVRTPLTVEVLEAITPDDIAAAREQQQPV